MSQGILLFAHNNGLINYGDMTSYCAEHILANMDPRPICLVTDSETRKTVDRKLFNQIIEVEPVTKETNLRNYRDGDNDGKKAIYHNNTRARAFELSPFSETLVLDTDYLVFDNSLDRVWGSRNDLMMNKSIASVQAETPPKVFRLDDVCIPMFWATAFFFRKTDKARKFFKIVGYVAEKFDYYGLIYNYRTAIYRNDHAFSVANHVASGYIESHSFARPLPNPHLLTSWDTDEILELNYEGMIVKTKRGGKWFPVRVSNNVHCMNKRSLLKHING